MNNNYLLKAYLSLPINIKLSLRILRSHVSKKELERHILESYIKTVQMEQTQI